MFAPVAQLAGGAWLRTRTVTGSNPSRCTNARVAQLAEARP
jgi:hypothetical protein